MKIESKSPDESGGSGGRQRLVSLKCVPHARSEPISIPSSSSSSSSPDHFFPSASPPSCPSPGFLSSSCKQAFRSKPFATTPIGGSPMPVRRDQVSQVTLNLLCGWLHGWVPAVCALFVCSCAACAVCAMCCCLCVLFAP